MLVYLEDGQLVPHSCQSVSHYWVDDGSNDMFMDRMDYGSKASAIAAGWTLTDDGWMCPVCSGFHTQSISLNYNYPGVR